MNNKHISVDDFFDLFSNRNNKKKKNLYFVLGCLFSNFEYDTSENVFITKFHDRTIKNQKHNKELETFINIRNIMQGKTKYEWEHKKIKGKFYYIFKIENVNSISIDDFYKKIILQIENYHFCVGKNTEFNREFLIGFWESKCSFEKKTHLIVSDYKRNCNFEDFNKFYCLEYFDFNIEKISFNIRGKNVNDTREHQIRVSPYWYLSSIMNGTDLNMESEEFKKNLDKEWKEFVKRQKCLNNGYEKMEIDSLGIEKIKNDTTILKGYGLKDDFVIKKNKKHEEQVFNDEDLKFLLFPSGVNKKRFFRQMSLFFEKSYELHFDDLLKKIKDEYFSYFKSMENVKIKVNEIEIIIHQDFIGKVNIINDENSSINQNNGIKKDQNKFIIKLDNNSNYLEIFKSFNESLLESTNIFNIYSKRLNNNLLPNLEYNYIKSPMTFFKGEWGTGKTYFISKFISYCNVSKFMYVLGEIGIANDANNKLNKIYKKICTKKYEKNDENNIKSFYDQWDAREDLTLYDLDNYFKIINNKKLSKVVYKKYKNIWKNNKKNTNNEYKAPSFYERIMFFDAWYLYEHSSQSDNLLLEKIINEIFKKTTFCFKHTKTIIKLITSALKHVSFMLNFSIYLNKIVSRIMFKIDDINLSTIDTILNKIQKWMFRKKTNFKNMLIIIDNVERLGKDAWNFIRCIKKLQCFKNITILFLVNEKRLIEISDFATLIDNKSVNWIEKYYQIFPYDFSQEDSFFFSSIEEDFKHSLNNIITKNNKNNAIDETLKNKYFDMIKKTIDDNKKIFLNKNCNMNYREFYDYINYEIFKIESKLIDELNKEK